MNNEKMIDLNVYTHKEIEAYVENTINMYHDGIFRNEIFKELYKLDNFFIKMRRAGLSMESIQNFLIVYFNYKVEIEVVSKYFEVYHSEELKS